jgi:histidine triad (HIT) family protein
MPIGIERQRLSPRPRRRPAAATRTRPGFAAAGSEAEEATRQPDLAGVPKVLREKKPAPGPRDCVFCGIIAGAGTAAIVHRDRHCLAFLDHRPLFRGHLLLAPLAHFETLADLPASELRPFFAAAQMLASAVERALQAGGTFVAINNRVSQSVPHLHVHIVPRTRGDGFRGSFWPRGRYAGEEEQERVRQAIAAEVRPVRESEGEEG